MKDSRLTLAVAISLGVAVGVVLALTVRTSASNPSTTTHKEDFAVEKTEAEWRQVLTANQYHILREHGTERPFTNAYHDNHQHGTYQCAGCGQVLFLAEDKYDSGTGWPSFSQPAATEAVGYLTDTSLTGHTRTEVHCSRCGGHLGHVFEDGPEPTGQRYCMNSGAMLFQPDTHRVQE